jgi:hypothetical protein
VGDKPIIRIAVPGDTAEDFMQAAAKQFRGDFFVAIDQPVGKFVRIEAPFLSGDVGVRGDAIAMPAVRNGRKGLVIRLVKLDADSLGIPIQEQTKELSLDEEDDDALNEFEKGQATVASNVSAAVAKSIRSVSSASDRAQPVKLQAPPPEPAKTSQPIPREELDDETREAVDEFSDVSTKASEISDEMAKKLTERSVPPATNVVRRTSEPKLTPADDDADPDSKPKDVHAKATAKVDAVDITKLPTLSSLTDDDDDDDDPALVTKVERPAAYEALIAKTRPVEPKAEKVEKVEKVEKAVAPEKSEPQAAAPAPPQASKAATATLVILILLTIAAAAFFLLYEL